MSRARSVGGELVGCDFQRVRTRPPQPRARPLLWLLLAAMTAALSLAVLRIDILRLRYALGEAIREEKTLAHQQREGSAQLESLSDPARLSAHAREHGFGRPERVIELRPAIADRRP